jgi:hypothetical protein
MVYFALLSLGYLRRLNAKVVSFFIFFSYLETEGEGELRKGAP